MSRKLVVLTGFLLIISIGLLGFQVFRYYDSTEESKKKEIQTVEEKIKSLKEEVAEKEKEKQSLAEEKTWKIGVYETWEKAVNSLG